LFVDEDAVKYYRHLPSSDVVHPVDDPSMEIGGFREDEAGAVLWLEGEKEGFEDNKLCRVCEVYETPDGIPLFDDERRAFLRSCSQEHWFEIAHRLGRQLDVSTWDIERSKMGPDGKRMMKVVGYSGDTAMTSVPWAEVFQCIDESADVLLWDGDWFHEEGWTHLIPKFLEADSERLAVAFQLKREVPGFHRKYWNIYQRFPGQLWMVVLDDGCGVEAPPPQVAHQISWLEEQYAGGSLHRPEARAGVVDRYVKVALMARLYQGSTPVVSINGGGTTVAQAAVELCMPERPDIRWVVFPGQRMKNGKPRIEVPGSTMLEFLASSGLGGKSSPGGLVEIRGVE